MQDKRYLLDLRQLFSGEDREELFQEAFSKVDVERRQKALHMKKVKVQAASLGAGLLLQKALTDHMEEPSRKVLANSVEGSSRNVLADSAEGSGRKVLADSAEGSNCIALSDSTADSSCKASTDRAEGLNHKALEYSAKGMPKIQLFSVKELLALIEGPVMEPEYGFGRNGKPHFKNYPLQFNLSHSGEYVLCGVSDQEIGVDIQEIRNANKVSLAKRFFSEGECMALERCESDKERSHMFFRMWTRKEAYGKLTGQGIAGTMKQDLWADDSEEEKLIWEEYDIPSGYRIAVCKYAPE